MPQDPIDALFSLPSQRLEKLGDPRLSGIAEDRLNAPAKPKSTIFRLPYMTYDQIQEGADDMYDPTDFKEVGNRIRSNVVKAIEKRFPVVGEKYTLKVENVHYEKEKNTTKAAEREIILNDGSLNDRLKGDWVLYDNATGQEIQRKSATLLSVPRMTSRGTFIRNGSELGLKHMFRLRPGIYTRIKNNGVVAAHINPQQTTGRQMSLDMDPSTGVFSVGRGTRTYGLLPILLAGGMDEETIKASWGEELFNANKAKYGKLMLKGSKSEEEYRNLWDNDIAPILLDKETTESTLGKGFDKMTPEALLRATGRILQVSRTMDESDTDDRDSLQYQKVMGPADYIPERIVRDGGGLLRNLFNMITRTGNLDPVVTGAFQPQVDAVFLSDKHAGYIDGSSPVEAYDFASAVSRIGEGGIGDTRAAPAETRGVNNSYLGFIDPIRCFTPDTYLLTPNGYSHITEINKGDLVGCLIDDKVVYKPAKAVYTYEKDMCEYEELYIIQIKNKDVSIKVTSNHTVFCMMCELSDPFKYREVPLKASDILEYENVYMRYISSSGNPEFTLIDVKENVTVLQVETSVHCVSIEGEHLLATDNFRNHKLLVISNSPESQKVGLDVFLSYGVKKDSNGNLYNKFLNKAGKPQWTRMDVAAKSIVATPEFFDPNADPEEFIPAMVRGKTLDYVQRKDVDYYVANSNRMLSMGAGMIPLIGGIRSNRTLMGCLHPDTLLKVIREGEELQITAGDYLKSWKIADEMVSTDNSYMSVVVRPVRGVHKVTTDLAVFNVVLEHGRSAVVNGSHKWAVARRSGFSLVTTAELAVGDYIPVVHEDYLDHPRTTKFTKVVVDKVVSVEPCGESPYLVDIDVDDNLYMLANGMFTHNSKYANQGVPLEHGEAPLVQRALTLDDGTETTSEAHLGKQLGARRSPVSGQVIKVDGDEIIVRGVDGVKHSIDLYRELPANQKGFLNNTPIVAVGDRVKEGQMLAKSNYTNEEGVAALGKNLKVAFMTARNGGTFEDGITISESAAQKLKSEQLYKVRGELTDDIEYNKNKFLSLFKQEYTNEQLAKIGDDGLPRPGAVFNAGDPVFLGVQLKDIGVHGLSRNSAVPYIKTWEHEEPGTILDVVRGRKHLSIYAKSYTPMKVGDKMCFDDKTEVLTDVGWKFFKDLNGEERVLTLDVKSGDTFMAPYSHYYKMYHKGKMYSVKSDKVDILVTDNHQIPVSCLPSAAYIRMLPASSIYGKALYFITGHDIFKPESYAYLKDEGVSESMELYEGYVYCITVPKTHIMYVRRNGKGYWSGNSNRYGAKGVVSQILPDDQMPQGADGTPFDVLQSPLGLPSRLNTSQLCETQLGKVAKATGTTYALPDFLTGDDDIIEFTDRELKKAGLSASEDVYDPVSGKTVPGIETGNMFFYKLKHMSELKERGRSTGLYSSEDVPMKGEGAARRFGSMEASAVYSGGGEEVLRDAKIIRGQRNDEFWRDFRAGKYPDTPGIPLVHKKFFAHLQAAGIHLEDRADRVHIYGAADSDIKRLSGTRKVTAAATFDSKNLQPIDGGLFDPKIFGAEGDQWGYVDLPEPVLNPMMFKTIGSVLGWKDKELTEYLTGARQVDGKFGPKSLKELLDNIDLNRELRKSKEILKTNHTTLQQRDLARKRIRAIEPMLREGKKPSDFFWDRIPILPPRFRAVTAMANGTNIAADANFLYKRLMDSIGDLEDAKRQLPEDMQLDARQSVYNAVGAVTGLMPTDDPKLESKGVSGVLKWAFGKGSPKLGSAHRKVFGANLDLGGLGTITPDDSLTIDQVGIPERSAWKMFEPFVVRRLTQQGYSLVDATRAVVDRNDDAERALKAEMAKRPILVNRAPTLWRYGIQGMYPVMVKDNTIHVNPNICKSYNADMDGDSMTTHVPVSNEAVEAVKKNMLPSKNLLSPRDFTAHFIPRAEFAQGLYLASRVDDKQRPVQFRTEEEAVAAYKRGDIKVDTPVEIG